MLLVHGRIAARMTFAISAAMLSAFRCSAITLSATRPSAAILAASSRSNPVFSMSCFSASGLAVYASNAFVETSLFAFFLSLAYAAPASTWPGTAFAAAASLSSDCSLAFGGTLIPTILRCAHTEHTVSTPWTSTFDHVSPPQLQQLYVLHMMD